MSRSSNYLVVFDIGTASVSAALVKFVRGKKPSIVKSFRNYHKSSIRNDIFRFQRLTVGQFSVILKDISACTKGVMPEHYTIGLSSPFYLAKTEHIQKKFDKPNSLSRKDLWNMINGYKEQFLKDVKRGKVREIETALMRSEMNGYEVDDPSGKSAREIDLYVRFSATSEDLYNSILEAIDSFQKRAVVKFRTFTHSVFALLNGTFPKDHNIIIVDVGGEITEVTFIINGIINEVITLPFGVSNVLTHISSVAHISADNALSLLVNHTKGGLSDEATKYLDALIKNEAKTWNDLFKRVWDKVAREMYSQINLYFTGGGALIKELKNVVAPSLLHPKLAKGLKVSVMSPDAFSDRFSEYCCIDGPGDFGLVSLILDEENFINIG